MEDRFKNILGLLSGEGCQREMAIRFSPYIVEGFKEIGRNEYGYKYKLETGLFIAMKLADPDLKHRNEQTSLEFILPASGDNVFTVIIEHYWGRLVLRGMDDFNSVELLCRLLMENTGTFLSTGAYLGITPPQNNTVYASLNSMLHFLVEWSDEQIAKVLSFHLAGMFKSLENNWDDSFTILKRF
ncbi:MAG TPA: hypothetical protein VKB86_21835 [Pyrinomonadaceae bacterium]|nr:hypothetical protein [Pyrinomonadaceae bacterium]